MTTLTITNPADLREGDRLYIDGEYEYTVLADPKGAQRGETHVDIQYKDGGTGTRVFPADVKWAALNITVNRGARGL